MLRQRAPRRPQVAPPVPVPQLDDPALIDVARDRAARARAQEGFEASLLSPGGLLGDLEETTTVKRMLGYG